VVRIRTKDLACYASKAAMLLMPLLASITTYASLTIMGVYQGFGICQRRGIASFFNILIKVISHFT
jgi:hypothetical protein